MARIFVTAARTVSVVHASEMICLRSLCVSREGNRDTGPRRTPWMLRPWRNCDVTLSIPPSRIDDLQGRRPRTVHIDGGDVDREVGLTRGGRSRDDACRECSPDLLMSREQDSCSRAQRLNHDPSLGPSVVGERWRVFHQFELQNIDEETNRSVLVVNHESDAFQLRHLPVS
jgi:hypothetical protein